MIRFHGSLYDKSDPTKIDPKQLDNLFYLVAAMKRNGIYTYLSFYYPLWLDASNPKFALPGYDKLKNKNPFALLYFDPRMQELYHAWATQILTTPNPYTNVPLAQDPALAIIEIVNEDSLFFWTFSQKNIPPTQWNELEVQFTNWLNIKYGSSTDHAALYSAYAMTRQGAARFANPRIPDQVRFLAENPAKFLRLDHALLQRRSPLFRAGQRQQLVHRRRPPTRPHRPLDHRRHRHDRPARLPRTPSHRRRRRLLHPYRRHLH